MPTTAPREDIVAGRWWRWTKYEVRDGCLRRARGATLLPYDPWADYAPAALRSGVAPYQSLLTLLHRLDDKKLPMQLADWCAAHGLLGLLTHRTLQLLITPRFGPVFRAMSQDRHWRAHTGWFGVHVRRERAGLPLPPPPALLQNVSALRWPEGWPDAPTWDRFFPTVSAEDRKRGVYPLPPSEAFWRAYAEPLEAFMWAARVLRDALEDVRASKDPVRRLRGIETLEALAAPIGPALHPVGTRFRLRWRSPSLLASFAMMASLDLTERGRVLACAACSSPFIPRAYQARYCTTTCRRREEQRIQRLKKRRKSPDRTSGVRR